jgi:hypothetical protein
MSDLTDEQWDKTEELLLTSLRDARSRSKEKASTLDQPKPTPIPDGVRPTWDLVIEHIELAAANGYLPARSAQAAIEIARERHEVGVVRYGTPLHPHNGRDHLKDAIAEVADQVVYLCNEREALRARAVPELHAYAAKVGIAFQSAVQQFVGLMGLLLERERVRVR